MAWYGVRAASVSEAARIGSRSSMGTKWRGVSTTMYSAIAPCVPRSRRDHPVQAQVLGAIGAHLAHTTPPAAVDDDRLPDLDTAGTLPQLLHDAGRLVPQRHRHRVGVSLLGHHHHELVGMTESRGRDPQQDFPRPRRGLVDLHELGAGAERGVLNGLHRSPCAGVGCYLSALKHPAGRQQSRALLQRVESADTCTVRLDAWASAERDRVANAPA